MPESFSQCSYFTFSFQQTVHTCATNGISLHGPIPPSAIEFCGWFLCARLNGWGRQSHAGPGLLSFRAGLPLPMAVRLCIVMEWGLKWEWVFCPSLTGSRPLLLRILGTVEFPAFLQHLMAFASPPPPPQPTFSWDQGTGRFCNTLLVTVEFFFVWKMDMGFMPLSQW